MVGEYPQDIAPLATDFNLFGADRRISTGPGPGRRPRARAENPPRHQRRRTENAPDEVALRIREQAGLMRDQVNYYLDRARAAPCGNAQHASPTSTVIAGLTRTFAKIYRDKELDIEVEVPPGLRFRGERQDLEEMARRGGGRLKACTVVGQYTLRINRALYH